MARQLATGCGLIFLLLLNDPASAQFAGGGQAGAGQVGAAPPAPVRKTIEDDGISAYTITDLGTLPDSAAASVATAATPPAWIHWQPESVGGINARGDVALNFVRTAGGKRIGIYSAGTGKCVVLSLPVAAPQSQFRAIGLADSGEVLGATDSAGSITGPLHPIFWKKTGPPDIFDEKDDNNRPQTGDSVTVNALSPNGLYTAGSIFFNGVGPTLAYWESGTLHHTDPLGQGMFQSWGVSSSGEVVGAAAPPYDDAHPLTTSIAFQWVSGSLQPLSPALAGANCGARAVNAGGDVAGWSETLDVIVVHWKGVHAVLWKNSQVKDLGTLGGASSTATAINDAGQIVGYAEAGPNGPGQAFLWESGKMRSLASLIPPSTGWTLGEAQVNYGGEGFLVINARGQIAGVGRRDSQPHAFLLTPRALIEKK